MVWRWIIYFMFDIFTSAKHKWKYLKKNKNHGLMSKINSVRNDKNIDFLKIHSFLFGSTLHAIYMICLGKI